jgi:hypothetical protein
VATKDRSRCIDFAYDPELREKTTQKNLGGFYTFWERSLSGSITEGSIIEKFENRAV